MAEILAMGKPSLIHKQKQAFQVFSLRVENVHRMVGWLSEKLKDSHIAARICGSGKNYFLKQIPVYVL